MEKDKKNNTKKISLVLIKKIGEPIYNINFENKKLILFLKKELIANIFTIKMGQNFLKKLQI